MYIPLLSLQCMPCWIQTVDSVDSCHLKEAILWLYVLFTELYRTGGGEEGGDGRTDWEKALWRGTRRKRLSGSGGTLAETRPSSFPDSPPVQPIMGFILIWVMIWILWVQPDYDSWPSGALRITGRLSYPQINKHGSHRCHPAANRDVLGRTSRANVTQNMNVTWCHLSDSTYQSRSSFNHSRNLII